MRRVDLGTFKTTKCEQKHDGQMTSNLHLHCPNFHGKHDRRRCPFSKDGKQLAYSDGYVENFYGMWMCSNMVEYLFHPDNYKTKPCTHRLSSDYGKEDPRAQQCPYNYCPYLHPGEDASWLDNVRSLPCSGQEKSITEFKGARQVRELFANPGHIEKHRQQVDALKERFRKVSDSCKGERLIHTKSTTQNTGEHQGGEGRMDFKDWYTCYNYFEHNERLPLIEDRHHEFKNFRDIVANDITPIVMKYVACFLNSEDGGVLYVGVDDDSVVHGLRLSQHEFDKFLLSVDQAGKYAMYPPLMPQKYQIRRIPVYNHRKGRELWVVEVLVRPAPQDRQQGILNYYNRECYMRMNASTLKMEALDLMEYIRVNQPPPPPPKTPLELLQLVGEWVDKQAVDKTEAEEMRKAAVLIGEKLEAAIARKAA